MFASRSSCTHPHPRLGTSPPSRSTYPRSAPRAVLSDPAVPCAGHPLPRPRIPVSALILRPRIRVSALILGPRIRVSAQTHPSLCTDTDRRPCTRQASSLCQHSAMRVCARSLRTSLHRVGMHPSRDSARRVRRPRPRRASRARFRRRRPGGAARPMAACGGLLYLLPAYGGLWRPIAAYRDRLPVAANAGLLQSSAAYYSQAQAIPVHCSLLPPVEAH